MIFRFGEEAQEAAAAGAEQFAPARAAGARGGKLLGAGGRGFLCLYAEPEKQAAVRAALRDLAEVRFRFGSEGSRIIFKSPE